LERKIGVWGFGKENRVLGFDSIFIFSLSGGRRVCFSSRVGGLASLNI
jgi:hypothetical protein